MKRMSRITFPWLAHVVIILFFNVLHSFGQGDQPGEPVMGWSKTLRGGGFQYHSPHPDVTGSLLLRSIDSVQFIEWETARVADIAAGGRVRFIWLFGIDANPESHSFRLFLNGKHCLTFSNPIVSSKESWKVSGSGGATLDFRPVMLDRYNDPMGYAILDVPSAMVTRGKPQVIRVVGETAGSRSWYMTFESAVEEKVAIEQLPAIIKGIDGNRIPLLVQVIHLGDPVHCRVVIDKVAEKEFMVETGFNETRLLVPETTQPGNFIAEVAVGDKLPVKAGFTIAPVRPFTIYLVQHTHTDIGYTRPQTEILPDHLRYIDYALDFCDQTDTLPDDARFRWTCETSWAVREYLASRPAVQVERFKQRVKEGRIEVTGLFLNGSDLSDEATVAASLRPVKDFRAAGISVKAAMQSDINGVPWSLPEYLPDAGIRFLNMAQNTHRARKPFNRPTTFWWESPSGKRLMVNRPEHYMWANSLGILTGKETFAVSLFRHLKDIAEKGYPYDEYAIQFSGYLTDNSPPSTIACNVVNEWNREYASPRLRLATLSEFMEVAERNYGDSMPVVRGAWPDWWMDGFGSAAIQTAYARTAHSEYLANGGLMAISSLLGNPAGKRIMDLKEQVFDDLVFYDEHTFGAAESITDPLCENSVVQLGQKEAYVWSAVKKNRILREMVMGGIQPWLPVSAAPTLTLFNTLGWPRSGNAMVYIDHQMLPRDKKFSLVDQGGTVCPMQQVSTREEGTWWMVFDHDLPALGYKSYTISVKDEPRSLPEKRPSAGVFENDYYRIEWDPSAGRIASIFDKEWNRNLVDSHESHAPGEVILERLGRNRGQLEQYRLDEVTRRSWENVKFGEITEGAVYKSLVISGQLEGCSQGPVSCEIRLFNNQKKIEFCYSMTKLAVTDPEAVYVAFPFALEGGRHVVQVTGGTMVPGVDQVPGSSSDWIGIQDFVALRSERGQIIFSSPEIPLVQLGGMNLGRFDGTPGAGRSPKGSLYSWVLNNYWTTNFLASQEGELKWSYHLTSGTDTSNASAARFGAENRVPVLNRVMPPQTGESGRPVYRTFFSGMQNGILLVSAEPSADGRNLLMQLRETNGKADSIALDVPWLSSITLVPATSATSIWEVNATGERMGEIWRENDSSNINGKGSWLPFKPFETRFISIAIKPENP